MGKWVRAVAWIVSFWMLSQAVYLWGGLALTPVVGKQLREQAKLQSPLAATYLFLGRLALPAMGLEERARAHAAERFSRQIADADSPPETVVVRFQSAQSAGERLDHVGGPLMLLLSLVLHARRQKPIRSFGVRD